MHARRVLPVLVLGLVPVVAVPAASIQDLVKEHRRRSLIRRQSHEIDKELDRLLQEKGLHPGAHTRVVPARDAGSGEHVGAYQVFGHAEEVARVRCVVEVEELLEPGPGRAVRLVPSAKKDAEDLQPVSGVHVGAAIDTPVWGPGKTFAARELSFGGAPFGRRALERSASAAKRLDRTLDRGHRASGHSTRVVPALRDADEAYMGLARVQGPAVGSVAALRVLDLSLEGRRRARVLLPVGSTLAGPPVRGVGVRTLIADASLRAPSTAAPGRLRPPEPVASVQPVRSRPNQRQRRKNRRGEGTTGAPAPIDPAPGSNGPAGSPPAARPALPAASPLPDQPGGHMGPLAR